MSRKDRQHYISRSYLRNFSPDFEYYLQRSSLWDDKRKKKLKDKMKIHFYDIEKRTFDYGNIYSLAYVDHYLSPTVDEIVRRIENKLSLLREIIKNRSEEFLYENDNQRIIWEISNCFKARSKVFRETARVFTLTQEGSLTTKDGNEFATLTYTNHADEYYQTCLFTSDPEILIPVRQKSFRVRIPSEDVDDTIYQIFEDRGLKDNRLSDLKEGKIQRLPEDTIIPSKVYPILIENRTNLPFITGDECVPKTGFVLPDLTTKIYYHFFPLDSEWAIILLEDREVENYFHRKITRRDQVHRWNKLIYECSMNYLFAKNEESLRVTINEPERNLSDLR